MKRTSRYVRRREDVAAASIIGFLLVLTLLVTVTLLSYGILPRAELAALWLSNGFVQVFLIVTLFTDDTFVLIKHLASSMSLMPYLFVAGFGLLTAWRDRQTRPRWSRRSSYEIALGAIACVYGVWTLTAGAIAP